jgi:hypothetical protein
MRIFGYDVVITIRKTADPKQHIKDAIAMWLKANQEDDDRLIPVIRAIRQIGYMFPDEFPSVLQDEHCLVCLPEAKTWAETYYPELPRLTSYNNSR